MEEARAVLERLERIEALERSGASPAELLGELRARVGEAELLSRREGVAVAALERCRALLVDGGERLVAR